MNCKDIKDLIGPYLYGDLSPEEMRAVRTHAQLCELCREDVGAQGALIGALANRAPQLTDDERQRIVWSVKGEIRARERERHIFGLRFSPAYALAAAVIVGMVAIKVVGTISARNVPKTEPVVIVKKVETPKPPNHDSENNRNRENPANRQAAAPGETGNKDSSSEGIARIFEGAGGARNMLPLGTLVDRHMDNEWHTRGLPDVPAPVVNPLGTPDVILDENGETKLPPPTGSKDVQVTPSEKNGANGSE